MLRTAPEPTDSTRLMVDGMTCSHCAQKVATAIKSVPGVTRTRVVPEDDYAEVNWNPSESANVSAVIEAIQQAGFDARQAPQFTSATRKSHLWGISVLTGLIPTIILMAGSWIFKLESENWFRITSLFLASLVQFGPGRQFYLGAWRQLKQGKSNMDTLVSLGSTTAYVYSCWILFAQQPLHLYFLEAASIITLISVGHWIEARTAARASTSLEKLLTLTPSTARQVDAGGSVTDVPISALSPGDRVVLMPGDQVPCDGKLVEGQTAVDESMLTGESLPVEKQSRSELFAGTTNLNGRVVLEITGTGQSTALARIISAVERAQNSKANVQRLADKISSIFVPIVVGIALATALWWGLAPDAAREFTLSMAPYLWPPHIPSGVLAGALITAVAVLIVACPCAMGIATPAAIMAGSNAAAEKGILIRDGTALEKAGRIDTVLFDKTGTLTQGKPEVVDCLSMESNTKELAASLGKQSNHPLSQAIATVSSQTLDVSQAQEVHGSGVEAIVNHSAKSGTPATGRLGSLRWLAETGVSLESANEFISRWETEGATLIGVALGDRLIGVFALKDTIKPDASDVMQGIQAAGMKVWLITGDNPTTARQIAQECGISPENVFANTRPEEKATIVRELQERGSRVAFVGDGINDAPALEQSDLGIAVSRASDIARDAADIVLLNTNLKSVQESLRLARATLRTIKQNLFWAFFYNCVAIPIAALGFMSPVICAATMGLSDLIVISNALRLRRS